MPAMPSPLHEQQSRPVAMGRALRVLVTPAAIHMPEVARHHAAGHRIVIAGDDAVGMSLAEVALPGAERLWINLRRSSELFRLRSAMEGLGGCDRMILAARGGDLGDGVTLMQIVLAVLPIMRRQGAGEITLLMPEGQGHDTIRAFLSEIGPELHAGGIAITLQTGGHLN